MKNVLFISYFAGVDANCPAEWSDDRLRAMELLGLRTTVLTNYGSSLQNTELTKIYRTPSLSSDDFKHELNLRGGTKAVGGVGVYILNALVFVFGTLLKALTHFLTRGGSGGKWSWIICSLPVGLWLRITKRIDVIYCTGGPPSAYLVGKVVSWLTRTPLRIEFQDPLVGAEINTSTYKQRVVRAVERMLLKSADLSVYVTKKAADDSRKRNPELAKKIIYNYPAAWDFQIDERSESASTDRPIQILHLGTLYGSRNLDKLFLALDSLYAENKISKGSVLVTNMGSVYTDNAAEYKGRDDFNVFGERQRVDALRIAKNADFLVLVQHDDNRSEETIPYKLYDYMNLNIPIIMLIKNPEIRALCAQYADLIADCGEVGEIRTAIESAVTLYGTNEYKEFRSGKGYQNRLDIREQVSQILFTNID